MKISFIGIPAVNVGRHNVKDPRLDQADKLVEAKKKVYVQVDVLGAEALAEAEALIVSPEAKPDLILQDLEFMEMRLERNPGAAELAMVNKIKARLEAEQFAFGVEMTPEEMPIVASYQLATAKPIVVSPSASAEPAEALILEAYKLSGFISFFTVGGKENRAWQIKQGATAWEAAGVVHSDIQKGFIRAEIISFADLIQNGGETQAKRAGKMRLETKDYVMQDCDITNFRFNK